MTMKLNQWLAGAITLAAACSFAQSPPAYPSKPVTIIVPFAAGGSTDVMARRVAALLTQQLGQSFVVDVKPGAGGMIGMSAVARAQPDGYTLGFGGNSPMSTTPHLHKNPPYDPQRAFTPISLAVQSSFALFARPDLPAANLADLIRMARAEPGKLTFASTGKGGAPHLLGELLQQSAGIELLHVPYKGDSEGVNAMLSGQVDLMFLAAPSGAPLVRSGKLKSFGVTAPARDPALPQLPTMAEAGQKDLTVEIFFGLVGPAGMPEAVVSRLSQAMKAVVSDPSYREAMEKSGYTAASSTQEEFNRIVARHNARWIQVIRSKGIVAD